MVSFVLRDRDRDTIIHINMSVPDGPESLTPGTRGLKVPLVTLGDAGRLLEF